MEAVRRHGIRRSMFQYNTWYWKLTRSSTQYWASTTLCQGSHTIEAGRGIRQTFICYPAPYKLNTTCNSNTQVTISIMPTNNVMITIRPFLKSYSCLDCVQHGLSTWIAQRKKRCQTTGTPSIRLTWLANQTLTHKAPHYNQSRTGLWLDRLVPSGYHWGPWHFSG